MEKFSKLQFEPATLTNQFDAITYARLKEVVSDFHKSTYLDRQGKSRPCYVLGIKLP